MGRFLVVLLVHFFAVQSFANFAGCGNAQEEEKLKTIRWSEALALQFEIPATKLSDAMTIHGKLCAGWKKRTGYSLEYFSFRTNAGFVGVYPIQTADSKDLLHQPQTVLKNEDVGKVSTVAAWGLRNGDLLTMTLVKVSFDPENEHTTYSLRLRFPEEMSRSWTSSQGDEFRELSLEVQRKHQQNNVMAFFADFDPQILSASAQVKIDASDFKVDSVVANAAGKDHTLLRKDLPVAKGAFAKAPGDASGKTLKALAERETTYQQELEKIEKRSTIDPSLYSPRGPYFIP